MVGLTGRYPQATDIGCFWDNLLTGVDSISEVPGDRWAWQSFTDPGEPDRYSYSRWGGFLDGIDLFDPVFFGILPRDAVAVDPQERIFLECVWNLLDGAGFLGPSTFERDTGVFVGVMNSCYELIGASDWATGGPMSARSAYWSVANRVSYFFDFHGPSFAVDSACSSSLLAIHLAAESVRRGECAMAIAGGVNLILHPAHYVELCASGMLSRDGRCKTFDERADGFVPGEGVGAVLMKPLDRAITDGDRIWGVVKGGSVRSEGRTMGYAVPSPASQAELIAGALRRAEVEPETVGYVEAHGTGTGLGDPVEIAGLSRAYGSPRGSAKRYVGSVKTNIGHLEGAAGVAGFSKAILQLHHGWLAPTINLHCMNTKIDFAASPFQPVLEQLEFPAGPTARRAAVSSFGAGGTDVHLIVEEYRQGVDLRPAEPASRAFLLSARNADQLAQLARDIIASLTSGEMRDATLASILYSSQVGRKELRERIGIIATTKAELLASLSDFLAGKPSWVTYSGRATATASGSAIVTPANDREGIISWCQGNSVAWASRWRGHVPGREVFPAYPFARKSYWPSIAANM